MPFAACTHCNHFFALDTERGPQTHCPCCGEPLRLLPRAEAVAALRRLQWRSPILPAGTAPATEATAESPIPHDEMAILLRTIVAVVGLAVSELPEEGCTCLINALCYAEQRRIAGEAWGEALVGRYHDVLDTYTRRYAVRGE
jgi:hypothetical protein